MLYFPAPVNNFPTIDGPIYDENYFLSKIPSDKIRLFEENIFVITENELNGYINYQINKGNLTASFGQLDINSVEIELKDQLINMMLYGNLKILPVKIESRLLPKYQREQQQISLSIEDIKLSKIKVSNNLFNRVIGSRVMQYGALVISEEGIFLPISSPDAIEISNVIFQEGQLVFYYKINSKKILEDIIKHSIFRLIR